MLLTNPGTIQGYFPELVRNSDRDGKESIAARKLYAIEISSVNNPYF